MEVIFLFQRGHQKPYMSVQFRTYRQGSWFKSKLVFVVFKSLPMAFIGKRRRDFRGEGAAFSFTSFPFSF